MTTIWLPSARAKKPSSVQAFHETSDGELLIGAGRGLFRRDGDDLVPIDAGQDAAGILTFYEASDGALIIGTYQGCFAMTAMIWLPSAPARKTRFLTHSRDQ
jgi:ligand-binding sensor domain-containing protein